MSPSDPSSMPNNIASRTTSRLSFADNIRIKFALIEPLIILLVISTPLSYSGTRKSY
jgi:hypothetical protein